MPSNAKMIQNNKNNNNETMKKVAIVGSGSAGIAALWALNRSPHDVYLYEGSPRLGGHTHTVEFTKGNHKTLVDAGFIVMNSATYPNFLSFLKYIGVETAPTEMSFSVSRDQGCFEWAGSSLNALFCQRKNLLSPKMWLMCADIIRFNHCALYTLMATEQTSETIGEYLARECYSNVFRDDYLIPMTAAVWSTSPGKPALDFPALTLIRFLWNHHLLSTFSARPEWLTIAAGSKTYIDKVMKGFPSNHLRLNTTVTGLTNEADGRVRLDSDDGRSEVFDHVILATHGDQAYEIIRSSATERERVILAKFKTSQNVAVLHSDTSLMPTSPKAWSSWNYLTKSASPEGTAEPDQVCLTYNMNKLQRIPHGAFGDVLVTLNPHHEPDPETVQGWYTYRHPLYTADTVLAQQCLELIQNKRGISYAGAWTKYGFHEDGFSSGLHVAVEHLGAKIPFDFVDSTFSRGQKPKLTAFGSAIRLLVTILQILLIKALKALAMATNATQATGAATTTTTKRLASKAKAKGPATIAGPLHANEN